MEYNVRNVFWMKNIFLFFLFICSSRSCVKQQICMMSGDGWMKLNFSLKGMYMWQVNENWSLVMGKIYANFFLKVTSCFKHWMKKKKNVPIIFLKYM